VSDDSAADALTGGLGTDWFVASLGDLLDRHDPELVLTL
jgi:hypothetical protein